MNDAVITGGRDPFLFGAQSDDEQGDEQGFPETSAELEEDSVSLQDANTELGSGQPEENRAEDDSPWGDLGDDVDMGWKDLSDGIDLSSVDLSSGSNSGIDEEHSPHDGSEALSDDQQQLMSQIADDQQGIPMLAADDGESAPLPAKKKIGLKEKVALLFRKESKPESERLETSEQNAHHEIPASERTDVLQAETVSENKRVKSKKEKPQTKQIDDGVEQESSGRFQLGGVALGVSLVLSLSAVGMSSYTLLSNKDNAFHQEIGTVRDDLVQKVDKVESEALSSSAQLSVELKTLTETLSTLTHKLERVGQQVDDLKILSDKMGSDNELSLSWSRQTRGMVDDVSKSIIVNESAINELRLKLEDMQAAIKKNAAVRQAAARQAAVAKKKKEQGPITEFAGYKLFSIDDWGGILLITLTKGDEVKRTQVGDLIDGWRIMSVDQRDLKVVLAKGGETRTLVSMGG